MSKEKFIYVGVDVSKNTLDVCIPNRKSFEDRSDRKSFYYRKIGNNEIEIRGLLSTLNGKRLGTIMPVKERVSKNTWEWAIVMENTGIYHKLLEKIAQSAGFKTVVVNSYLAKRWNESRAVKKQTDKIDSYSLYDMAVSSDLKPTCYDEKAEQLKRELALERRLKKQLQQLKPTGKNLTHEHTKNEITVYKKQISVVKSLNKYVEKQEFTKVKKKIESSLYLFKEEMYAAELTKIEKLIENIDYQNSRMIIDILKSSSIVLTYMAVEADLTEQHNKIKQRVVKLASELYPESYKCLKTIPGVGDVLAVEVLAATNGFEKFDKQSQFLSYIGVVPGGKDSGTSVKSREEISQHVNRNLRHVLVSAAWIAQRYNEDVKQIFVRLTSNGKIKGIANVAAARKLAIQMFVCGKYKKRYESELERKRKELQNTYKDFNNELSNY